MWYQNIRSASFTFVTIHVSDRWTDKQNCESNTARCIRCSHTVKNFIDNKTGYILVWYAFHNCKLHKQQPTTAAKAKVACAMITGTVC